MSYNPNFYSNFGGNNSTFQRLPPYFIPPPANTPQHYIPPPSHFVPPPALPPPHFAPQHPQHCVPPPPQPPPFFIPSATPAAKREKADQEFLSTFDNRIPVRKVAQINVKHPTLSDVREEIRKMFFAVIDLKAKQKHLTENMSALTEEEWSSHMNEVEVNKAEISKTLTLVTGPYLETLQKLLAKRSAKRMRLKRLHLEKKREKEERMKELKEKSRKIDENLQKIKDDINKAKQEAEEKLQADMVLKEVLCKKSDARKCLTKLDAVQKLRKARQNTATGRGESVSDMEAAAFNTHIDKLKSLWARKLILYEMEEGVLRAQLKAASQMSSLQAEMEQNIASNLAKWRETLFGGQLPQVDFGGDVARFVGVRSQWDRYISREGTALPIGWVPPAPRNDNNTA